MADDLGYSDIGCYGGEVQTPNLDRLAADGIRYKQFYNAARCCPTRASLISGLYPHQAGMGWMAAADLGTPPYQGNLNDKAVTIAEVLRMAGYRTYMTGKWHLTNERKIDGMVTDNWPLQRGFDRYFGIVPGGANYFTPVVYSGNQRYKAPEDFYLTDAISDTSVQYIGDHFTKHPDKPLFMYVAYTAPHWPLHALQQDIDKYKHVYQAGWDKLRVQRFEKQQQIGLFPATATLSARDATVPAWDGLSADQKEDMAMRMATYAAQIDNMDQGIGRIIQTLESEGQLDNTLFIFLSDNGACAEFISSGKRKAADGKEDTFESYRINWANLSSTPFKEYKHYTYEGGIATPLIVHWPKGVDMELHNTLVSRYGHLTDIMPTCVDVSGATYPSEMNGKTIQPMEGKSLAPHFAGLDNHRGKIFWEHEANIAMRDGKWKLVAKTPEGESFDPQDLHLYNLEDDPIELTDLAISEPKRVKRMYAEWQVWAMQIGAFPLDTRNYGLRAQTYRRVINGGFDDNLGGWKTPAGAGATVSIDTTGKLTGSKSAYVAITNADTESADMILSWPFPGKKGERFEVGMTAVATKQSGCYLRLEQVGPGGAPLTDEEIAVETNPKQTQFVSGPLPADGQYRLAFYFEGPSEDTEFWIDDVVLRPVQSEQVTMVKESKLTLTDDTF
ncbi:hypothetical protein GCM10007415_19530 [Parapedobacter pyrenivorans]|uniref:Sulfatase N-terminal domain-containing protein n=2 Tax=Parapedobacter pyrenivorans TaxID=1305674 RepID=A0A917HQL5_9SPHI|nr:hypothetical protein GCM10007415_19530 [Parapedobacter pyrenivorans]